MKKLLFLIILVAFALSCEDKNKSKIIELENRIDKLEKELERLKNKKPPIEDIQEDLAEVVKKVYPVVVTIFTYQKDGKEKTPKVFRYFDDINPFESESLGSGFIIKKDNRYLYIVTNAHVIGKSKKIVIKFYNNYETTAEIQGIDQKTDIAVLKVKLNKRIEDIEPAKCGTIKEMKTGYFVIAAGSPYSLGHTFTFGIISALGRTLGISTFENFIQTDAAINPGDSGGPLLNLRGEVIGMNTAIIQTGQGLGFAIPIDIVKPITEELIKYGRVIRGWLGVLVQNVSEKLKEKYKIGYGVLVIKVFENSPAQKAGIKVGDIILKLDNVDIENASKLKYLISQLKPDKKVRLEILRNGKSLSITVHIEEFPSNQ